MYNSKCLQWVQSVGLTAFVALTGWNTASLASTLLGNEIQAHYEYPSVGNIYGPSTVSPDSFIVGYGIEAVIDVETVTQFSIDFSASSLLITLTTGLLDPQWTDPPGDDPSEQNGPVFSVVSGIAFPAITNVSVSEGLVIAFLLNDKLYIDWRGWSYHTGDTVRVDFATSPVPLPAALPLLAAGIAAMGLAGWQRKRQVVEVQGTTQAVVGSTQHSDVDY